MAISDGTVVAQKNTKTISIIVPCFNEADNLDTLIQSTIKASDSLDSNFEILFVNDGSVDATPQKLNALAAQHTCIKVIHFSQNHGQSAALQAGFDYASGDIIVTMDADLQNDPADIPMMLQELGKGYDLIFGWRQKRSDPFLSRKLPSMFANRLIAFITSFPAHDIGCGLKAMKREVLTNLLLVGDFHRYIPILAHWQGARCKEVIVRHHPRRNGKSKYGIDRIIKVLLDLITIKFFITYMHNPMRLFGRYGLLSLFVGVVSGFVALILKMATDFDLTGNPLSLIAIFLIIIGVQFFFLGMLGELCARIYYDRSARKMYSIREMINIDEKE